MEKTNAKLKLIDRIYAEIPDANCQGLCYQTCGPIAMSRLEGKRIIDRIGRVPDFGFNAELTCDLLDPTTRRCTVYDDRPAICRLWGVVDKPMMTCPFGCTPAGMLSDAQSRSILDRIERIGA